MRDEIDGRLWVRHHDALGKSMINFVDDLRLALAKLYEVQFDAPWKSKAKECSQH